MSFRHLILVTFFGCGMIGCTNDASTPLTAEALTPEVLESYKNSFSLADEPTQVVSILDARSHLAEPTHISHSEHDHAGHAIHEHVEGVGHDGGDAEHHSDHDGHDHSADGEDGAQAGDHGHAESNGDHEGHDHEEHDHAGHAHDEHAGHGHESHGAAEHRDPVVLVGKIGGAPGAERSSAHFPFDREQATFVMYDPSFETAEGTGHQHADGHDCPFCQSKAQDAQAIVRFIGKDGKPLPVDARELFNIKEDDLVVVKGQASVKAGMLIVDGEGLYVRE